MVYCKKRKVVHTVLTHKGTQVLHTPRLTLRRFTPEDAQAMYENWANDERVTRYLTWAPHTSADFTRQLLEQWCSAYDRPDNYQWAIEYEHQPIGSIGVVSGSDLHQRAELGYCMGYSWWSRGLMTEAVQAVCDYLLYEVGFHRLEISHAVENPGSGAVARKCGFFYEGTRRGFHKSHDGRFLDIALYGLLRENQRKAAQT